MGRIKNMLDRHYHILFIAIPVLYFIIGAYFRYILGDLSIRSLDPDYVYFITGLEISNGHFNVTHIDHPGTPLQLLMGLVYRITYLFRPGNNSFLEDVFANPDLYMAVSNMAITGITTALLFYAGIKTFKKTKSVGYGLLIQCTPFLPVIWFDIIGRIYPELMLPIPILLLELLLVEILFGNDEISTNRNVWLLSAISALGLSVKLTFIPIWFIPLIILKDWKARLRFLLITLILFLLFSIPVIFQLNKFTGWIKAIFVHSGQYGGGDSNFVNWHEFKAGLQFLWTYEHWFLLTAIAALLISAVYFVLNGKKADKRLLVITISVLVAIVFQTIMVCKHFGHRYYVPALLLSPLLVILISETTKRLLPNKLHGMIKAGIAVYLVTFFIHQQPWIKQKTEAMSADMAQRIETWHFVSTLNANAIKIIATQNYGGPYKEYALMTSYAWAGRWQKEFKPALAKLYPNSYLFFTWDSTVRFWGDALTKKKIVESNKPIYLYLENDTPELFQKTIQHFPVLSDTLKAVPELLYKNEKTKEMVYKFNFSTETQTTP